MLLDGPLVVWRCLNAALVYGFGSVLVGSERHHALLVLKRGVILKFAIVIVH